MFVFFIEYKCTYTITQARQPDISFLYAMKRSLLELKRIMIARLITFNSLQMTKIQFLSRVLKQIELTEKATILDNN